MKSSFKKYFFMFAIFCMAITCVATFGYADFIFNYSDVTNGIGDSENSITQTADPIRQNAVFGEAGDASASGTQYYDVYFMSQSIENIISNGSNQIDSYYYMPVEDGYSNSAHFGAFYGDNGEELTSDISQNRNRYFTKLENVAELSIQQMNLVGQPKPNKLYDGNTSDYFSLEFLCWSITPEPIYTIVDVETILWWENYTVIEWPNSNQIIVSDNNGYRVAGYYPSENSSFSPFYTNTLLSIYDDFSKEIHGKKCLFVYPVYTIGKDYISSTQKKYENCVDSVTMHTYDESKKSINTSTFIYDGAMSKQLNSFSGMSNYSIFRLDNIVFDINNYLDYKYTINVDRSLSNAWEGTRYIVTDAYGTNVNNPSNSEVDTFYDYAFNVGQNSGRYNIYLISKSNGEFETAFYDQGDNKGNLSNLFEQNNISIYYQKKLDYMSPSNRSESRDYYIVYERIYEPRLIGGTTGSFNYQNNSSFIFTRVSPTGAEKNHYILRSILLDPLKTTSFVYDGETRNIKNNYFAVQLLPEDGMEYNEIVPKDNNIDNPENNLNDPNWPRLVVSNEKGENQVIPYLTESLIGKDFSEAKLVRTNDFTNSGLYNLYIKVIYALDSEGKNVPSSIEIYAYQFNDMYINVYDGGESSIVYHKEDSDLTNIDETGYLMSAACSLRMINLKQGSSLTSETPLTYYQEVNGKWEVIKDSDGSNKIISLFDYLTNIEHEGDCLRELVSGEYITLDNYQNFVIDKNYAFIRCDKPSL